VINSGFFATFESFESQKSRLPFCENAVCPLQTKVAKLGFSGYNRNMSFYKKTDGFFRKQV